MLLITFHGGKNLVNNVYAYHDSGGDPLEKAVLKGADNCLKDGELRGLVFAFGHLYVDGGIRMPSCVLKAQVRDTCLMVFSPRVRGAAP
jgi:hypothetical protein